MVSKYYEWLLNMSVECIVQKSRKCACIHTCAHTEKHVLDKKKYQSQLNVVLLIGSHTAASMLTAIYSIFSAMLSNVQR